MLLTELGRAGALLVLGDSHGRTHVVQVLAGEFAPGLLPEALPVRSFAEVRRAVSDTAALVLRRVREPRSGLDVACTYAEGLWFRLEK